MSAIDFLPPSYREKRAARQRRVRRYAFTALAAAFVASWWLPLQSEVEAAQYEADALSQKLHGNEVQKAELKKLQAEQESLQKRLAVREQMIDPVDTTQVLALLANLAPDEIKFDRVSVSARRPAPEIVDDKKKKPRKEKEPKAVVHEIEIEIDAFAPNDRSIVNFVGAIDQHPLFSSVKVPTNRNAQIQGYAARQFRLLVVVDLNREIHEEQTRKEMADADS